jgi:polyphosphate kinase 2 (PPK2 family)
MSGPDPPSCRVRSFKKPSDEELDHTFLWGNMTAVPEQG